MQNDLEKLRRKAVLLKKKNAEKMSKGYHYAKSLGFSPAESALLMGWSKERVDKLARQREVNNGETT